MLAGGTFCLMWFAASAGVSSSLWNFPIGTEKAIRYDPGSKGNIVVVGPTEWLVARVIAIITGLISMIGRPWAFRTSYALESQAEAQFDLKKMSAGEFVSMGSSDYTFIAKDVDLAELPDHHTELAEAHAQTGVVRPADRNVGVHGA